MKYQLIPGEPDAVVWFNDDASGVIRDGDPGWLDYQQWLTEGDSLEQERAEQVTQETAMAIVEQEFERACGPLRAGHSQSEIDCWPQQAAEARAYLADDSATTPLIDGMALPWEDKEELCREVIVKSDQYAAAMGDILMWRRIAVAAVEAMFEHGPRNQFHVQYPEVPSAS